MMDYTSAKEKLQFSPRMEAVRQEILPRLKCRDLREGTFCSELDAGDQNPFLDVFLENPQEPYVINLANAIVRSWLQTPVVIHPNEALVGITRPTYPFMEHFSWGIRMHDYTPAGEITEGLAKALQRMNAYNQNICRPAGSAGTPPDPQALTDALLRMTPLEEEHRYQAARPIYGDTLDVIRGEGLFSAGGYQGHTIPNHSTLLELGLDGMLEKVRYFRERNSQDEQTQLLYRAWEIILQGMRKHLLQYAEAAAHLAETEADPVQKTYYLQIHDNCSFVASNKPRTLYQAAQLMWCLCLWDWVDCLGRIDQFLLPFYQISKTQGDVVPVEDILVSLVLKIWENGSHNSTLSGCKPEDGTDATNELTFLFLQILRTLHDVHPRMAVRIISQPDPKLISLILQMWSEGMSDPSIVGDTCVIPGLEKLGVSLADARDYATLGCQEIEIPGKCNTGCEDGLFNVAKALEIAMLGGKSTKEKDRQIGPKTKHFLECESFEALYESFEQQLAYFVPMFAFLCDRGQEERAANHAKLVKGIFTDGCVERGMNHDAGGPIYNHGVVETAGIAATADALTAIKKLVFDEKRISASLLWDALQANFVGYERQRQMLLNLAPKFGNDDADADAMACRVLNTFWDEIAKYRSVRGGPYTGACSLLTGGVSYGLHMGAMADGRFAGEPLGNSIGPRPGADKSGLTAMLNSVSKLPLSKGVGGTTLNVLLNQRFLADEPRRQVIGHILTQFMRSGGQLAQITTANLQDLQDAKCHPERHGDLIVRVGGFSAKFVTLTEAVQDEIISRYAAETM